MEIIIIYLTKFSLLIQFFFIADCFIDLLQGFIHQFFFQILGDFRLLKITLNKFTCLLIHLILKLIHFLIINFVVVLTRNFFDLN